MQQGTIRVLIVDDIAIIRAGLRSFLGTEADIEVVGESPTGHEALEAASLLQPDVVLMDIGVPVVYGLEATREMRRRSPGSRVVALTVHESEDYFFAMLKAGASGYVLKEAPPYELVSALRAAHQGGVFVSPSVAKSVLRDYVRQPDSSRNGGLTGREGEILRLLAKGHTNMEVARSLCLSVKTVEKHRASVMDKLGFQTRSELVGYALQKGLIY